MTTVQIDTGDGMMNAYVATPPSGHGPGLVVIQEIFGVNQVMRDLSDGYAAQGFVAICPDLFWRLEPGIDITDRTQAEWAKAFQLFNAFDAEMGLADIAHTIGFIRHHAGVNGKVGAVGYCLGGKLAFMTATGTNVDASVGYYGIGLDELLGELPHLHKPLMLHIAGKDQFVKPEAQAKIHAALGSNRLTTVHDYPDEDHAFARLGGQHYRQESADLANRRTLDFFRQHLA
jgi:carboxymethylenebutenolidase